MSEEQKVPEIVAEDEAVESETGATENPYAGLEEIYAGTDVDVTMIGQVVEATGETAPTPWRVYARVNGDLLVTAIQSSDFLPELPESDWVLIDEGYGDKYHHAQSQYLDKPITDERGVWRYALTETASGVYGVEERTQEEMDADAAARPTQVVENPIEQLQAENTLLRAQLQALSDRGEFVEDCLAEMAMVVYAE